MVSIWRRIYSTGLAAVVLVLWSWGAAARAADGKSGESNPTVSQPPASATSTAVTAPAPAAAPAAMISTMDPLLQLLVTKSVLTSEEANGLSAAPASEMRDRLVLLLKAKGILSAEDLSALNVRALAIPAAASATVPATTAKVAPAPPAAQHKGPTSDQGDVIPAVEPLRVLQVDPPRRDGIIPAIKIGENISLRPYGSFKTSAVYDSTSPYGNDFPLPFFNPITNGPDRLSEFHMTDRALRLGANFEWLDLSPHVVLTGKLELDFAGNFTRSNNSNIGSMRSSSPQIRLGYGRIDWKASDSTTVNFLAGQDWTPFGSSTLPNLFEYTGLGMGFGTLYERDPQFRFGVNHKFGNGISIEPDFAIVMPAYGNLRLI